MMKNLLKYSLLPLLMTISCATAVPYQSGPVSKADPYKTACTVFDIKIASIYTDGWKKEAGDCITKEQFRNTDPLKPFICTGAVKESGANVSFALDMLTAGSYSYRFSSVQAMDGNGEFGSGHVTPGPVVSTPYTSVSVKGKSRLILSGKVPSAFFQLEVLAPKDAILGPLCWQIPYINVE